MQRLKRREFLRVAGAVPIGLVAWKTPEHRPIRQQSFTATMDPWLEVNLNHIAWNLAQIRQRVSPRPVMGVIKANAYGHGLVEVAKFLEKQNIRFLAVGKVQEALLLRESGVRTPILNFGPFSASEAPELVRRSISQSVYTDEVAALAEAARRVGGTAKVHIKVDTGLGRVGVPHHKALPFIEKVASYREIEIEGVFTTFTEDEEFDRIQLDRFLRLCTAAGKRGISVGLRHAASSAGVLAFPQAYLDMVRPGITLYGHYPSEEEYEARKLDLRPAMALKARVVYLKTLRPGDSVSYHRAFTAQQETRVATLAIGYSDGYPYQVGGKADVIVRGRRWPAIALVTANHTTLDVTGAVECEIGDEAVLIGRQGGSEVTAEEVAAWTGTSVYKILIGMSPLLPRVYVGVG